MRLGCHLSVAKGFATAAKVAPTLGANAFQYFTKNPRGFRNAKPLNREDAERGRRLMQELDLVAIGHTPYLINLAAADDELYHVSIAALVQDLVIAEARGTYGVVVHCGKPKDRGRDWGIERMQHALRQVLDQNRTEGVQILVENTAGQGSEIGASLDELLAIVAPFAPHDVGICFDTQHAFAAGMMTRENPGAFPGFDHPDFMRRLTAIHLNDSKVAFAAHKDRHELIGQGALGLDGIARIVNDPRLADIPFYLETPVNQETQYADEIATVKSLIEHTR
ncbi:MAG: endonuclease IV [Sulfobacillus acidophilus]|uniref:Probable endonuclease 4 n=1 Tax=Sulfobacillus acidophilus TaxID=53633 RepID=A0A2T2WL86_9FIRM|nr:MAG: endonuclease IV [Sulfobacillus acidophilus]